VLRPGGRYLVSQDTTVEPNPIQDIAQAMHLALGGRRPLDDRLVDTAASAGLRAVDRIESAPHPFTQSPSEAARQIETRAGSTLWDVDEHRWETIVMPAVAALRALSDPDEPVGFVARANILVFER